METSPLLLAHPISTTGQTYGCAGDGEVDAILSKALGELTGGEPTAVDDWVQQNIDAFRAPAD